MSVTSLETAGISLDTSVTSLESAGNSLDTAGISTDTHLSTIVIIKDVRKKLIKQKKKNKL